MTGVTGSIVARSNMHMCATLAERSDKIRKRRHDIQKCSLYSKVSVRFDTYFRMEGGHSFTLALGSPAGSNLQILIQIILLRSYRHYLCSAVTYYACEKWYILGVDSDSNSLLFDANSNLVLRVLSQL